MNICLYGASSPEIDPVYLDAAYAFGFLLAQHGHTLVYGGGAQGVHTGLQLLAFQFKSLEVTGGDQHGQALRQQVVAAITGLNRHHIAKATQVFHIGTKNDFHTGSP